ncbi:hypothetical protein HDU83_001290 [Entophlyctis luteolus]|nr:hypothetical protein HDU83_001290 [Entophlyctis luteolus]
MGIAMKMPAASAGSSASSGKQAMSSYPWLASSSAVGAAASRCSHLLRSPDSVPHAPWRFSLWEEIKRRNEEQMGRHQAQVHLPHYDFARDFKTDASRAACAFLTALNDVSLFEVTSKERDKSKSDSNSDALADALALLRHTAMPSVSSYFARATTEVLSSSNLRVCINPLWGNSLPVAGSERLQELSKSRANGRVDMPCFPETSMALLASDPRFVQPANLRPRITAWHWIYGPPANTPNLAHTHVQQHWLNFYTVVIPRERAGLCTYHELRESKEAAIDAGIVARIYVHFDVPIEVVVLDHASGIPLLRDVRQNGFALQFTSPHFTPWDEVLEPYYPADGVPMGEGIGWKTDLSSGSLSLNARMHRLAAQESSLPPQPSLAQSRLLSSSAAASAATAATAAASPSASKTGNSSPSKKNNSITDRQQKKLQTQQKPTIEGGNFLTQRNREEEWRLKWDWRVCDVDYLFYKPIGNSVKMWGGKKS